ncbi:YqaE/Pmp3 family membrane protein [Adhaeribacter sp. BT258]|uniref:YqaE/Pmp3 family membrane protein n=1 Tax=Adhaeribacter terrigena TaxID=2793070 RepID=A0ABS1C3A7_9BACT|nr:YqaE/Pmp3 family membrane protein [Adhaeribacter terrigena]
MNIVELIFAIILPPVGVLLHEGGLNGRFWISLLLTLLFFFPGMIYAILVVTDTI